MILMMINREESTKELLYRLIERGLRIAIVVLFLFAGLTAFIVSKTNETTSKQIAASNQAEKISKTDTKKMPSIFSDGGAVFSDMSLASGTEKRRVGFGAVPE